MRKNIVSIVVIMLSSIAFVSGAWAAAFTVNFADINMENVQPGVPVSLLQKASFLPGVNNADTLSVNMCLEVTPPNATQLKAGYEPIPDVNWIKLDRANFWIKPHQTEYFDMVIYTPYNEKYFGKKYQAMLVVYTLEGVLKINIKSKIFISFTGERFKREAIEQKITDDQTNAKMLMINPKIVSLTDVNLKRKLEYANLVITNNSSEKLVLDLYTVGLANVPAVNGLLRFKETHFELNNKESKNIELMVNLPLLRLRRSEPMLFLIGAKSDNGTRILGQFSLLNLQFN